MKKFVATMLAILAVLGIMFAEYRYIMRHIIPYIGEDGTVYLEVFDQVDEYDADKWEYRNLVPLAEEE